MLFVYICYLTTTLLPLTIHGASQIPNTAYNQSEHSPPSFTPHNFLSQTRCNIKYMFSSVLKQKFTCEQIQEALPICRRNITVAFSEMPPYAWTDWFTDDNETAASGNHSHGNNSTGYAYRGIIFGRMHTLNFFFFSIARGNPARHEYKFKFFQLRSQKYQFLLIHSIILSITLR